MQPPGSPYAPPPPPKSGGFPVWLIVLLSVLGVSVVLIGIMAVLAVAGVRRYVALAKTAEAVNGVGQISRDASMAYEEEATTGGAAHVLCASASHPVPVSVLQVSGKKYLSSPTDWSDGPAGSGFGCLKFTMDVPQYYQYDYRQTGSGGGAAVGDGFEAEAKGDLDGDGVTSDFKTTGSITSAGVLTTLPGVTRTNEDE